MVFRSSQLLREGVFTPGRGKVAVALLQNRQSRSVRKNADGDSLCQSSKYEIVGIFPAMLEGDYGRVDIIWW